MLGRVQDRIMGDPIVALQMFHQIILKKYIHRYKISQFLCYFFIQIYICIFLFSFFLWFLWTIFVINIICQSISVWLSFCLPISLPIYLSIYQSYLFICPSRLSASSWRILVNTRNFRWWILIIYRNRFCLRIKIK